LAAAGVGVVVLAGCGSAGSSSGADGSSAGEAKQGSTAPTSAPSSSTPPASSATATAAAPESYDSTRDAAADVAAAKAAAAKDGRPVLIDFGANWCPDCVVLGKTFTQPSTASLLANYHVVRVDVGEFDHNLELTAHYVDLQTSGIPALAVMDSQGHAMVNTNQGEFASARSMPEAEVDAFLKKWM
jgi:protein disulfide-isomerase